MTAINFPFAASAPRRAPDADELANGFGCGPADKELFDWLSWYFSGQIDEVITAAGIPTDDADLQQLLKAIRILARIDPTASTVKAPKLSGLVATALAAGTNVPANTQTKVNYGTTKKNNLGSSSWNGNTLTVGAGEAGLWLVSASLEWPTGSSTIYSTLAVVSNTGISPYSSSTPSGTATGVSHSVSAIIPADVGDTIWAQAYYASGGPLTTLDRDTCQFSAFLISAY